MKTLTLELDDLDHEAIQRCISRRQGLMILPDGDGNLAGRVLAEICRGWEEFIDRSAGRTPRWLERRDDEEPQ